MTKFNIELAGIPMEISANYDSTKSFCSKFFTNKEAMASVIVKQADIDYQRSCFERDYNVDFSDSYIETLALQRNVALELLKHNTVLFHGVVLEMNNEGFLFTAASGTGKTTHAKLWQKVYGDKVTIINGDKPFLKVCDDKVYACGAPWQGNENYGCNRTVQLKAICHIVRAEKNSLTKLNMAEMFPVLWQQTYRPLISSARKDTLDIVSKLSTLNFYCLECNISEEAAVIAYNGMKQ